MSHLLQSLSCVCRCLFRPWSSRVLAALTASLGVHIAAASAMDLTATLQTEACRVPERNAHALQAVPVEARHRLPESQLAAGRQDVGWVWLASPTLRYPHRALGSPVHAGSVQAQVRSRTGAWKLVELTLPLHRVYEDRQPRIVDLDRDGSEDILLIEADALRGASLVVLGLDNSTEVPRLVERARSAFAGSTFRWLNPVGVADFDGDRHLDIAVVYTPHIGGDLRLLHYRPPLLVPFARAMDVSNHRMGALEQEVAVIVQQPTKRPAILVPDMTRRALLALRWDASDQWSELGEALPMPGLVERLLPMSGGACATLADGRTLNVLLSP